MTVPTPVYQVPDVPPGWDLFSLAGWDWSRLPTLEPFLLWDGSRPASQQTSLRLCTTSGFLVARFDCNDRYIWGTYTRRDDPLYNEEVVEIFLAPGEADPVDYFEFEVSPHSALFDAHVHNPGDRHDPRFAVDVGWNCPRLRWEAGIDAARQAWWATLAIPLQELCLTGELPSTWRANFYRIERPHDAEAEFSCWSPTLTPQPDFHVPRRFGVLSLVEVVLK